MDSERTAKVTDVTLASDEPANAAYEAAYRKLREGLGFSYPNYIDGEAVGRRHPTFDDRSPGDADVVVARFPKADPGDVTRAIAGAAAAFRGWSATPWAERAAILRRAAELLSSRRTELAALMTLEVGKNRLEAMGDAEEAADLIRYYAGQLEAARGFETPLGRIIPNEDTRSVLRPYGVFGVVAPFNFPLALAAGMSAGALLAGNTVVFKPSSEAPLTGLRLYEALAEAGVPPGAFQFVTGGGGDLGAAFLDERLDGIVFTGSKRVGMDLLHRFSPRYPRPVIVEMGGKNPAIVTRNADLGKAAEGVARSAFGYGGQKCSACSRAFVERAVYDGFLDALAAVATSLRIGDPADRATYLGPVIDAASARKHAEALAEAQRDGRIAFEGKVPGDRGLARGHYVPPVVADRLPEGHRLMREELFLPFLCVAAVDSLDEAIERSNDSEYGLTAGIFSEDPDEIARFFDRIEAGVVYANRRAGATTGAWPGVQAFCGWKGSGSTGKGGGGPWYVPQFLREQSRTVVT